MSNRTIYGACCQDTAHAEKLRTLLFLSVRVYEQETLCCLFAFFNSLFVFDFLHPLIRCRDAYI